MTMTKGELTKQHILAKSAVIFNTHGYAASSISEIMAATGLKKGGIYRHFASKDQLILDSFDYAYALFRTELLKGLKGKRHVADRLLTMATIMCNHAYNPDFPGGCPIMNAAIESTDSHPALKRKAQEAMQEWQELIKLVVDSGVRRGQLNPDTDADVVASLFISLTEGAVMLSRLENNPVHAERALSHLSLYLETIKFTS